MTPYHVALSKRQRPDTDGLYFCFRPEHFNFTASVNNAPFILKFQSSVIHRMRICLSSKSQFHSKQQKPLKGILHHWVHYTHRAANNKGVPCLRQQRPVVVVDWASKPLGSSPDAWLALKIARCVLNTPRQAVSRLKTAGRKSVFPKRSLREMCVEF